MEFEDLIPPLVSDGDVAVAPSLPGSAFSNPIRTRPGPIRIAEQFHELMVELFRETPYFVQGGDSGGGIGDPAVRRCFTPARVSSLNRFNVEASVRRTFEVEPGT